MPNTNTNFLYLETVKKPLGRASDPNDFKWSQNMSVETTGCGKENRRNNCKRDVSLIRQKTRKEKKSNKTRNKKKIN